MVLIGFTGKKGVGKSTACKYLEETYGFVRHNFKDALIKDLKLRFPELLRIMSIHYMLPIDDLFEVKPPMVRALMQNYGTNVCRAKDPNHWIKEWRAELPTKERVLCDDVRFLNEAAAIKANGGIIIQLVRPEMEHTDTHQSETEMDGIEPDYVIELEEGNFTDLHADLAAIYEGYYE